MVYARKKINKDAWTNLGPTSVNLFLRPQCCKPQILEDLTNIVIVCLTFTL